MGWIVYQKKSDAYSWIDENATERDEKDEDGHGELSNAGISRSCCCGCHRACRC